jgi:hypothetical protein
MDDAEKKKRNDEARDRAFAEGRERRKREYDAAVKAKADAYELTKENRDSVVPDEDGLIAIPLSEIERTVLLRASNIWDGPTWMTDFIARSMWFDDKEHYRANARELFDRLEAEQPLSALDWHRLLVSCEMAFAVLMNGGAWDWTIVAGIEDETTIHALRAVQRKVLTWARPFPRSPDPMWNDLAAKKLIGVSADEEADEDDRINAVLHLGRITDFDDRLPLLQLAESDSVPETVRAATGRALGLIYLRTRIEQPEDLPRMTEPARAAYNEVRAVYQGSATTY